MTIPDLGSLIEVNLREAWNHEAHNFTPWLASHLGALSAKIGIPLELEGQEVAVESFSADILARNPQDDSLVLIENQLEGSDHTHLGQIMTYLAGLNTHTVVWVAAAFREPHLSALRWLNDNTDETFAFFAVQIKAVRIDDSPIAPIFEVLIRPNHWERKLQAISKSTGELSPTGQFRKAFWTHYVDRFPDEQARYPADAAASRWRSLDDIELNLSLYLSKTSVGLFVRGARGVSPEAVYVLLQPHAAQLTERLGVEMGSKYLFSQSYRADAMNTANWNELSDWLHSTADTYEMTLRDIVSSVEQPNDLP
jgi:hypothetical protein